MTNLVQHLQPYWQLTRMNRPIGILLLLWPTLTALWIAAGGLPDIQILLIFYCWRGIDASGRLCD